MDSAMRNVITPKVKPVLVFARDFCMANIVTPLSVFCANSNVSTDAIIGFLMALLFLFSKVLFDGT